MKKESHSFLLGEGAPIFYCKKANPYMELRKESAYDEDSIHKKENKYD